jgi:hypothetical protein
MEGTKTGSESSTISPASTTPCPSL